MRWFEQYRFDWITECLRVYGFINREHLQKKFGISQPQASKDLTRYQRQHPGMMRYNLTTKRYEAKDDDAV